MRDATCETQPSASGGVTLAAKVGYGLLLPVAVFIGYRTGVIQSDATTT